MNDDNNRKPAANNYKQTLHRVLHGDFQDASDTEKEAAARDVITACSVASGAAGLQPVPLADLALLAPIQITMVQALGHIHGYTLTKRSVAEILGTFGGSIMTQATMRAAARIVPGFGWIMSASMAYALTWAMGEASALYFKSGRGMTRAQLSTLFEQAYARKRARKDTEQRIALKLKDRLQQLEEAYAMGLIEEHEYQQKKVDLITAL